MKQVTRCEFGGGLSEVSLNRLIIKLIKKNIRIPSGSHKERESRKWLSFFVYMLTSSDVLVMENESLNSEIVLDFFAE